jgi:hypothetical protein
MLLSDLKNIKFDLFDYPESEEKAVITEKLGSSNTPTLSTADLAYLADADFALIIKEGRDRIRKFPLCDVKTASVSKLFLQAHKTEIPATLYKIAEKNINLFLTKKQIGANEISTKELFAREKEAGIKTALAPRENLPDSDFALVINNSGAKARFYPINDEHNCKLASEYFSKNMKNIPIHLRHEFAKSLVCKCASAGFDKAIITDDIRSYCNNRVNPDFDLEIKLRQAKVASAKVKEALDVLLDMSSQGNLQKIAKLLHQVDKEFGLDKYYSKNFSDAYRAVFDNKSQSEKTAGVSIVGEYDIDPQTLSAIPYSPQMQDLFSQEDFSAIQQDPAAFQALPSVYKQAIQQEAARIPK